MQVHEGQSFSHFIDRESGASYSDIEFRRCYFQGCALALAGAPEGRSKVRNIRIIDCSQRGCSVKSAIVEDVVVDGLKTNGLFQAFGAVYNRVVLRGKIDRVMLANYVVPSLLLAESARQRLIAAFQAANAEYYRGVTWALDISQGEFKELDIRGVPARLIRRDPETQIMLTRDRVAREDWRSLSFDTEIIPFRLDVMLKSGVPDDVFIAPKRHKRFRDYLEDFRLLRRAGVAEPD